MKKALIILLVLAVAGGLFAQSLTFSGNVRTGMDLRFQDGEDAKGDAFKPTVNMGSGIAEHPGRLTLNGTFNTDDGVAGVRFEMQMRVQDDGAVNPALRAESFYGFIYFLDRMVQVVGGRNGPGGFGTMGGIDTSYDLLAGGGATFGVLVRPLGNDDVLIGANIKGFGAGHTYSLREVERTWLGFGAFYRMPDLFSSAVTFRTNYGAPFGFGGTYHAENNPYAMGDAAQDGKWDIAAGVNVLALADLGISRLAVDFALENMDHKMMKKDNNGNGDWTDLKIGQRVEYTSGDLNAALRARQSFLLGVDTGEDKGFEEYAPILAFAAHVQYTIDSLVPRLDAGFIMNGQPSTNFRRGWDTVGTGMTVNPTSQQGMNKYAMGLSIAPSLRVNMTRSWIEFGYTMSYDMSKEQNDEGKGLFPKDYKGTRLRNMIYIDMQVSF